MATADLDELDFGRDGAIVLRGLVPPSDLPHLPVRSAPGSDGRRQDLWRRHRGVRDLARHPAVMEVVGRLYGRRPIPFQTLNFDRGTAQPLHIDALHFDSVPSGRMCGAWVALESVGSLQGPLQIAPGSHLLEPIDPDGMCGPDGRFDMALFEQTVVDRVDGLTVVEVEAEPGDVVLWDARLAHGGAPVLDPDSTRRSQVTHYFFAGDTYVTPMRSQPAEARYRLRDPLTDIATGRWVRPSADGRRIRPVHGRDGLAELPSGRPISPSERLVSDAIGSLRLARAAATEAWLRVGPRERAR